jgi:hypothetical protein
MVGCLGVVDFRKLIGGTWAGTMAGSWYLINRNKYLVPFLLLWETTNDRLLHKKGCRQG